MVLTLRDNPELRTLPVALAKLKALSFINVSIDKKANTNLIIPTGLSEKLQDEGNGFYVFE